MTESGCLRIEDKKVLRTNRTQICDFANEFEKSHTCVGFSPKGFLSSTLRQPVF